MPSIGDIPNVPDAPNIAVDPPKLKKSKKVRKRAANGIVQLQIEENTDDDLDSGEKLNGRVKQLVPLKQRPLGLSLSEEYDSDASEVRQYSLKLAIRTRRTLPKRKSSENGKKPVVLFGEVSSTTNVDANNGVAPLIELPNSASTSSANVGLLVESSNILSVNQGREVGSGRIVSVLKPKAISASGIMAVRPLNPKNLKDPSQNQIKPSTSKNIENDDSPIQQSSKEIIADDTNLQALITSQVEPDKELLSANYEFQSNPNRVCDAISDIRNETLELLQDPANIKAIATTEKEKESSKILLDPDGFLDALNTRTSSTPKLLENILDKDEITNNVSKEDSDLLLDPDRVFDELEIKRHGCLNESQDLTQKGCSLLANASIVNPVLAVSHKSTDIGMKFSSPPFLKIRKCAQNSYTSFLLDEDTNVPSCPVNIELNNKALDVAKESFGIIIEESIPKSNGSEPRKEFLNDLESDEMISKPEEEIKKCCNEKNPTLTDDMIEDLSFRKSRTHAVYFNKKRLAMTSNSEEPQAKCLKASILIEDPQTLIEEALPLSIQREQEVIHENQNLVDNLHVQEILDQECEKIDSLNDNSQTTKDIITEKCLSLDNLQEDRDICVSSTDSELSSPICTSVIDHYAAEDSPASNLNDSEISIKNDCLENDDDVEMLPNVENDTIVLDYSTDSDLFSTINDKCEIPETQQSEISGEVGSKEECNEDTCLKNDTMCSASESLIQQPDLNTLNIENITDKIMEIVQLDSDLPEENHENEQVEIPETQNSEKHFESDLFDGQSEKSLDICLSEENIAEICEKPENIQNSTNSLIEQPALNTTVQIVTNSQLELDSKDDEKRHEKEQVEIAETQNSEILLESDSPDQDNSKAIPLTLEIKTAELELTIETPIEITATQDQKVVSQSEEFDSCEPVHEEKLQSQIEIPETQNSEDEFHQNSQIEPAMNNDKIIKPTCNGVEPLTEQEFEVIDRSEILLDVEEPELTMILKEDAMILEENNDELSKTIKNVVEGTNQSIDESWTNIKPDKQSFESDTLDNEFYELKKTNLRMHLKQSNKICLPDLSTRSKGRALREQARIAYPMESDEDILEPEVDLLKELSEKLSRKDTEDGQLHYMKFLGLLDKKSLQIMLYEDPVVTYDRFISKILKDFQDCVESPVKNNTPFMIKDILPEIDANKMIDFSNVVSSTPKRKGRKPKKFDQTKNNEQVVPDSLIIPKIIKSAMKTITESSAKPKLTVSFGSNVREYYPDKRIAIKKMPDTPTETECKEKFTKEKYARKELSEEDAPKSSDDSDELIIDEREKRGKRPKAKVVKEKPLKGKRLKELTSKNKAFNINPPVISFADDGIKINGKNIDSEILRKDLMQEDATNNLHVKNLNVIDDAPIKVSLALLENVASAQIKLVNIDTLLEKRSVPESVLRIPENHKISPNFNVLQKNNNINEEINNTLNTYISKIVSLPGIVLTKVKNSVTYADKEEIESNYSEMSSLELPLQLLSVTPEITVVEKDYSLIEDLTLSNSEEDAPVPNTSINWALEQKILKKLNNILKTTLPNLKSRPVLDSTVNWIVEKNILKKYNNILEPVDATNDACVFSILNHLERENSQATIYGFNQIQFTFMFRCILGYNVSKCTHPKPLDELMDNLEPLLHSDIITDLDMAKLEKQFETCKRLNTDFKEFYLTIELGNFMKIWKFMRKFWGKSGPKNKQDRKFAEKIKEDFGFYNTDDFIGPSVNSVNLEELQVPIQSTNNDFDKTPMNLPKQTSDLNVPEVLRDESQATTNIVIDQNHSEVENLIEKTPDVNMIQSEPKINVDTSKTPDVNIIQSEPKTNVDTSTTVNIPLISPTLTENQPNERSLPLKKRRQSKEYQEYQKENQEKEASRVENLLIEGFSLKKFKLDMVKCKQTSENSVLLGSNDLEKVVQCENSETKTIVEPVSNIDTINDYDKYSEHSSGSSTYGSSMGGEQSNSDLDNISEFGVDNALEIDDDEIPSPEFEREDCPDSRCLSPKNPSLSEETVILKVNTVEDVNPVDSKLETIKKKTDTKKIMEFTENIQQNKDENKTEPTKAKPDSLMQDFDSSLLDRLFDEQPSCSDETAPHEATNLEIERLINSAIKDIAFWSDVDIPNDQDNNTSLTQNFPNEYQNKERNCMISGSSQDDVLPEGSFGVTDALSGLIENDMVVLVNNTSFSGYNKSVNMDSICGNPALWRKNYNQSENSFSLGGEENAPLPALDNSFGLDESSRQSNDNNNAEQVHIGYHNKESFSRPAEPDSMLPISPPQLSLQQDLFNKINSPIKVIRNSPDANNLVEYAPEITEQDISKTLQDASPTHVSSKSVQFDCIEVHGNNGNSLEVAQKANTLSTINYDDFKISDSNFSPSQRSLPEGNHTPSYFIKSGLTQTANSPEIVAKSVDIIEMELSQNNPKVKSPLNVKCDQQSKGPSYSNQKPIIPSTSYISPVRTKSSPVSMSKHTIAKVKGPPVYTICQNSCVPVPARITSPCLITEHIKPSPEIKTATFNDHTSSKRRHSLNMPNLNSDDEASPKYLKRSVDSLTKHRLENLEMISDKKITQFLDRNISSIFENIAIDKKTNEQSLRSLGARKSFSSVPPISTSPSIPKSSVPLSRYVLTDTPSSLPTPQNYHLSTGSSPSLLSTPSSKVCTPNDAFDQLKASSPDCLPLVKSDKIKILNVEYLKATSQSKHSNIDKCQRWLNDKECNPQTHRAYASTTKPTTVVYPPNREIKSKDPAKSTLGMINFAPKSSTKPSNHLSPYSRRTHDLVDKAHYGNFAKNITKGSSSAHSPYRQSTPQSTIDKYKRKDYSTKPVHVSNPNSKFTLMKELKPTSSPYKKKPVYTKLLDPINLADSNVKMGSNWSHERSNFNLEAVLEDLGTLKNDK